LRKNISELSILLATISFNREDQTFRWGLGNNSADNSENILQFSEENMADFLDIHDIRNLLKVSNNISAMELPPHLLIIVMLIVLFSRDGVSMEGHCAVDAARIYYLQLLHRYIKLSSSQGSKINSSLHTVLKIVKDFGEEMRSKSVETCLL